MKKLFSILILAVSIAGCAQFGLQQPKGVDQSLAYAYGTVDAARIAATTGLKSATVTLPQAEHVRDVANQAQKILDDAKAAKSISDTAASNKAMQATALLLELQNFLIQQGAK
jgi:hypothetical protein